MWITLSKNPRTVVRPPQDLRPAAIQALRQAGFSYLLVPTGAEGDGPLGDTIAGHEREWGLTLAGQVGKVLLFRTD